MTKFKKAIIVANNQQSPISDLETIFESNDLLIAADGGANYLANSQFTPDILIGDLDSIDKKILASLISKGTEILSYPTQKDKTDLDLAIQHAISYKVKNIIILSALGKRWDHTIANIMLIGSKQYALTDVEINIIDDQQQIHVMNAKKNYTIEGTPGNTVSLIPITKSVKGITTSGLEYKLTNDTIFFGTTLGISNSFISHSASITFDKGQLICIVIRKTI
ncbi:MAG TPA: thiamine diphosphokinase [Chloroflexi bacterium]|nr:thiamine diphosphokinase [Chloroflexota bacterium]